MKNREEIVRELTDEAGKDIYNASTDEVSIDAINRACAAVRANCRSISVTMTVEYGDHIAPTNGKVLVYIWPDQYAKQDMFYLLSQTKANEEPRFYDIITGIKVARATAISYFHGHLTSSESEAKEKKQAEEAKLRRELEIKSEFDYKRNGNRYY